MGDKKPAADFSGPAGARQPLREPARHAVKDPSMEEILASIRRILSEEQSGSKSRDEAVTELLLDSSMRVPSPGDVPEGSSGFEGAASPHGRTIYEAPDGADDQSAMAEHIQPPEGLIDDRVANEVVNSIGSLLRSIGADRSAGIGRPGLTLEDMVREELKPMLKAWLETHLPGLVERVVRAEINRLTDIARH